MRTDSIALTAANQAADKEPYIVVEFSFDDENTDLLYLTSNDDADTPAGEQVIPGVIEDVSGTSQRLDVKNFNSTIGSMSVTVVDIDGEFSDYLRTKLANDLTITKKRVRFFLGYPGIDFDEYALLQTQIVEREEVENNVYDVRCYDVQRQQRKEIFERKETILNADVAADDDTIEVKNASEFETYYHGSSFRVNALSTVGHLLIVDGDKKEIITYTGKSGNTFTGVSRAQFGTKAQDFLAIEDSKNRNLKVYEYIYLEMPAVKLAYAILTGSLYNDAQTLPGHWNLGIDSQYVATSHFTTIGSDWWDPSDDTKGRQVRFEGLTKTDGKKFIETELYGLLGAFSPILSTGELGLKRLAPIVSSSSYVAILDETNIVKASKATYSHDQVVNFLRVNWGYDDQRQRFRRSNFFVDPSSRDRFGLSALKTLNFKGLQASAGHSADAIRAMFEGYRDRFAGPPISMTLQVLPSLNVLEVGDVVRVNLSNYPDYFGDSDINRSFEIQQVTVDYATGKVTIKVAGSTQRSSGLIDYDSASGTAVPDATYTSTGTDIESEFSANVSRSGSVVTVDSDFTITGTNQITDADSIFYVDGDFTIPFGRTVYVENNVQLRVKGFFNCFGKIDGKGRGHSGEDYRRYANEIEFDTGTDHHANSDLAPRRIDDTYPSTDDPANYFFVRGFLKAATSIGVFVAGEWAENPPFVDYSSPFYVTRYGNRNNFNVADNRSAPYLEIDPDTLTGFPPSLWGQGGPAGDPLYYNFARDFEVNPYNYYPVADGGSGGNGGAGLAIICRGMDLEPSGIIDLSGDDGGEGSYWNDVTAWNGDITDDPLHTIKSSDGAPGLAGALYIILDGVTTGPTVDGSYIIQQHGIAPDLNNIIDDNAFSLRYDVPFLSGITGWDFPQKLGAGNLNRTLGATPLPRVLENAWEAFSRVQFLIAKTDADEEPDEITDQPLGISLTEYTNTPQTPEGSYSTIDITVTPPSATNYSHSIIEARIQGDTGWQTLGPAQHERSFTTDSDGSTWEFRALAVSTTGVVLTTGPVETITLGDFSTDYATIRPPSTVTGLRLTGEAVGAVFTTPDLQFTWNLNNVSGTGYTDSWFDHFRIRILNPADDTVLVDETIQTNVYTFTLSENKKLSGGPYSSVKVEVSQVTRDDVEGIADVVTFTNAAPSAPTAFGLDGAGGPYSAKIKWTNPTILDLASIELYLGTTTGFTPSSANKVFEGLTDRAQLVDLSPSTEYFLVARAKDTFGLYSSYTAEENFTTPSVGSGGGVSWGDVTDKPTTDQISINLYDISQWVVGSNGTQGDFAERLSGDNSIELVTGPFGESQKAWVVKDDAGNDDGGFLVPFRGPDHSGNAPITTDGSYRFTAYVKFTSATANVLLKNQGALWDGPSSNDFTPEWIPSTPLAPNKWYLIVGMLHADGWAGTSSGQTGIYDVATGEKLFSGDEFTFRTSEDPRDRIDFEINLINVTSGSGYIVKPRLERITDSTAPLISLMGSADNTQNAIDSGGLHGVDSYDSGAIYMRIPVRIMGVDFTGSYSSGGYTIYGASFASLQVLTNNASLYDFALIEYYEPSFLRLDDWNPFVDRRFKCAISIGSNAADVNPNLKISVCTGGLHELRAGGLYCKGFGFYLDDNWDFYGFAQTDDDPYTAPETIAMGVGSTDQTGTGVLVLEASYDHSEEEVTFTIHANVVGAPITKTLSLSSYIRMNAGHAFQAMAQKVDNQTDDPLWDDSFSVGACLFDQKGT